MKKYLTLALSILVLNLSLCASAFAGAEDEKNAKFAENVKANIAKLGTGPGAKIEVKLYDNTKLKGYVTEAKADRFVIVDSKTGISTEVPYPQVKQVKGNNLSGKVKFLIGVGIILVIIPILFALSDRKGG